MPQPPPLLPSFSVQVHTILKMPPANPKKPDPQAVANSRNEYIPSFIAKKPFYVPDTATDDSSSANDYLEHQRLHQKAESDSLAKAQWYTRGQKLGPAATKYRKGACENCGSMTHKAKDCLSRPRKHGAKWTGRNIQADEVVQKVELGWDAKRDRWNGYDAAEYQRVVDEYKELEEMKRKVKKQTGKDGDDTEGEDEEGDVYEAETDMGREQSTSTRNLRIREDTAKYLLNLDLDSAKYDPKTRSMVDTGPTADDKAGKLVADEGFVKMGGEAAEFERVQRYAWETHEHGSTNKVHLQANPTAAILTLQRQEKEAEGKRAARQQELLQRYGGQEYTKKTPADTKVTESERFVEYDESGGIKGAPKVKPKSKYPEDILINNHTSVWGSWWKDFKWGYACCHSTVKNSYCTGEEGKKAFEEAERRRFAVDLDDLPHASEPEKVSKEEARREEEALEEHVPNTIEDDRKAKRNAETASADAEKRKRTLKQMQDGVTEEEMDEYRRKRLNTADPMAAYLGQDELVK